MSELSELYLKTIAKKAIAIDGRLRVLLRAIPETSKQESEEPSNQVGNLKISCDKCDEFLSDRKDGSWICAECECIIWVTEPNTWVEA